MTSVDDVAVALVALLTENRHKPPRVQARKIAEHLHAHGLLGGVTRTVTVGCQACTTPPPWGDPLDWMDPEQVVIYARHLERFVADLMAERADRLAKVMEQRRTA